MTKLPSSHQVQAVPAANNPKLPFDLPTGLLLIGLLGFFVLSAFNKPKKGQQGKSYWGGAAQLKAAKRKALKQIPAFSGKKTYTKANSSALYIGTPARIYNLHQREFYLLLKPEFDRVEREFGIEKRRELEKQHLPKKYDRNNTTLWFPNTQQSTAVFGAAGTGKSFSILNPLIRSALDQWMTVLVYDFKYPEQTKEIVGYALKRGYKIQVIAPSYAESSVFNIFDFIKDAGDSIGAGELAYVLTENTSKSSGGGNEFFETGGASTLTGGMLAAKWLAEDPEAIAVARRLWKIPDGEENPPIADVLTCAAILNVSGLADRIKYAEKRLNPWILQTFSQFSSAGGATQPGKAAVMNVTQAGILANAQKTINQLVKREFIPSICGKSNVEINLSGKNVKTLTIVGLNQDYRKLISPLLATVLDLIISRNVAHSRKRTVPFFVSLDELPSIKLPKIANWLAEARSAGFCGAIGLQNPSQLKEEYGDDRTQTIMSNCATKHFLNPQDKVSAQAYSDYLGEQELRYYTTSTSQQKGGSSKTRSEGVTKVPLMEAAEFLKMDAGRVVTISPGYENPTKKETYLPILHDIKIPQQDLEQSAQSEQIWTRMLEPFKAVKIDEQQISLDFKRRIDLVNELLPMPPRSKTECPVRTLIDELNKNGYGSAGFENENELIDLNQKVKLPDTWKDPEQENIVNLPTDTDEGLSQIAILVSSTGYKIFSK
jgi:type IV secretory pathway TraG/TraD family ATPase VirD4